MKKQFIIFIGPLVLIALWWTVNFLNLIDPLFLPNPIDTFIEFYNLASNDTLLIDALMTLKRVGIALLISISIGVPLGLFLGKAEKIYRSVEFIIDFFRSTPATAIFPLFLLIFGVNDGSKIAVAAFAAIFIIIFHTAYGVRHANKMKILAAKIMGASQFQIFHSILFWESLPHTFIGIRNTISWSLVVIIVTEMFVGTNIGIGKKIIDFQIIYNIEGMYAAIILAGFMGYALNHILLIAERKTLHWKAK